ncbi:MAG TPA: SAM-dependent methyltransferase [Synechococcales bacterium UBA10510]|nr:SAM-dependent methyltransferase [Synechococcales bacterium UBA10510]
MDLFNRQWSTYRQIVDHDLMEHRALSAVLGNALTNYLQRRQSTPAPDRAAAAMVDLGCGDLALLAPLLRQLPLSSYLGLDLSPQVLPLARQALGPVAYSCQFQQQNLINWAQTHQGEPPVQLLHSSYALHHLSDQAKGDFLRQARQKISGDGLFLWADVFRQPGESLANYLLRYSQRINSSWQVIETSHRDAVIHHITNYDLPADREQIVAIASACGWQWQWLWQGSQQAEALAALTPA